MSSDKKFPEMVDTRKVAEILGMPEATIRYWRSTGTGPKWIKMGRRVWYDVVDVHAYIDASRVVTSQANVG